jgi:phosphoribosyl 1,2-cyclic phosphate phosphodiesterase
MRIQLLGTGSAEGWPGLFCDCDVCRRSRQLRGKNLRSRTSALIDGALKIDLPPDTHHHALTHGLDMSAVRHLLFTHAHDDHCAGYELQYLSWMFIPHTVERPLEILAPRTTVKKICAQLGEEPLPLSLQAIDPWKTVEFGRWHVTPILASHDPKQICFNYLLSDGARTLLYASDTGWYSDQTWDFLRGWKIDGAVIECSKGPVEGGYSGHMNVRQVIDMRGWLVANGIMNSSAPVVTTHLSHLGGLLHEELESLFNPHGIQVGYDGMELNL